MLDLQNHLRADYVEFCMCKRGHSGPRDSKGQCIECRNRRQRELRAVDPDKYKAYSRKTYLKNDGAAKRRKWREDNPERERANDKRRRELNPEKTRAKRQKAAHKKRVASMEISGSFVGMLGMCKRGHFAPKSSDGHCLECRVINRAENKEAIAKKRRTYRLANREKINKRKRELYVVNDGAGQSRAWREREGNRERATAKNKQWLEKNPSKREEYNAKRKARYHADHSLRLRIGEWKRAWYERNKPRVFELVRKSIHKRRAQKLGNGGSYDDLDLKQIRKAQKNRCAYCKKSLKGIQENIDHIIPLSLGGTSFRHNIQLTCERCNKSKGPKDPLDFARQLGMLL